MKALTLTQPWASLVACGAKRIETRSWNTRYRGPLSIHAAAGLGPVGGKRGLAELLRTPPFWSVYKREFYSAGRELPLGCIVAVAVLVDVQPIHENGTLPVDVVSRFAVAEHEVDFGHYAPGRFAWLLDEVRALDGPVECKGALGLWNVPPEVAFRAAVAQQVAA